MKRHQQILAVVLVVQIVLSVVTFWPRPAATGTGEPVFEDFNADDVVALTIMNEQRDSIVLRKEGDTWGLAEAENYPAKVEGVTSVLDKIAKLSTGNIVARTASSHKQLQVAGDDYMRRLDVEMQDGTTHIVYLGSAPRYTATHFRVSGQAETYLTTELSTWDLNPTAASWVDTQYTQIDTATLTEVVLQNTNGTFTLVKSGEDWTLVGLAADEQMAAGKAIDIVNKSARVNMLRPLSKSDSPDYGFSAPLAMVTLKSADATYTLHIGAKNPTDNSYTVKSSESDYFVAVAEYNVTPLVENAREDFLQQPEAQTTTP
jgi:hypothetical protein